MLFPRFIPPSPAPAVPTSLCSSMSPLLTYRQVHRYHLSRSCTDALIHDMCLSVSEWLEQTFLMYIKEVVCFQKGSGVCKVSERTLLLTVHKWSVSHSVVSDSLWPHELEPTRLVCPWNSPGKNSGVGCHFLLQFTNKRACNYALPYRVYYDKAKLDERPKSTMMK